MTNATLDHTSRLHQALAHPARLRILAMLREGELCACQITAVLQLAPSTVSAHLAELRGAELVLERKQARWVHYRLVRTPTARRALANVWRLLEDDATVRDDAALLRRLRSVAVEELCRVDLNLKRLGIPLPSRR